ncbi:carbohydrate-binding module family 20 domain-containing protein [Pseudomonas frederiksbergensis]|uniref:carbohydrate-binding module family 20 domain-containing protein n=1 Tax=Pseudomonas frederiksbergensis TaxID=104087 RepID=UPI003D21551B
MGSDQSIKRAPTSYPTWTGKVLFPGTDNGKDVQWKCIVRHETIPTDVQKWQDDPNNIVKVTFTITSVGTF